MARLENRHRIRPDQKRGADIEQKPPSTLDIPLTALEVKILECTCAGEEPTLAHRIIAKSIVHAVKKYILKNQPANEQLYISRKIALEIVATTDYKKTPISKVGQEWYPILYRAIEELTSSPPIASEVTRQSRT